MAFPSVEATANGTDTGTSHTINRPAGHAAGDYVLYVVGFDSSASISDFGDATELVNVYDTITRDIDISVCYELLSGGESSTFEMTTDVSEESAHIAFLIRGAAGTPEVEPSSDGEQDYTGLYPDPPSLTASWGSADNLWFGITGHTDQTVTISSYPSGYSGGLQKVGTTHGVAAAYKEAAAATENPGTFTLSDTEEYLQVTAVFRNVTAPAAPTDAAGTASGDSITGTFTDNSSGTATHRAYYKRSTDSIWIQAADLDTGETSFVFEWLAQGTAYDIGFTSFDDDSESPMTTDTDITSEVVRLVSGSFL